MTEIFARKAAADRTLVGWGKAHRFAGSKDRAAIAARVFAVLRQRNQCAFRMQSDDARALVIGSLSVVDGLDVEAIAALATDGSHALGAMSDQERAQLAAARVSSDPWVRLNYPEWLHAQLTLAFGDALEREMRALNERAPLDLRVNALKTSRAEVLRELGDAGVEVVELANTRHGLRVAAGVDAKVTALAAYGEGRFEIQDEASQRAVALAGARPGETVIDLAAGAGGKALALTAEMANSGRVIACDIDVGRLRHSEPRIERSGATIVEQAGNPYGGVVSGADLVFVDAPCSGSGTWRRNPEAKWTLDAARLETYLQAQARLLDRAAELLGPGGRVVFAVCSILPCERYERVDGFLARHPGWRVDATLDLTPARDGADGFFAARLVQG
ncbi:MAG: RsmB/NOP family class I SAM-dependent RNA methyltransferase [Alphaproteobacteria bacterium]|nr:RsmB/NOP family class I SAM-dependent RNA methyltransferase [Alphaproteobacteria bacterium]